MNKLRKIIQEEIKLIIIEEKTKTQLDVIDDLTSSIAKELEAITKSVIDQNQDKIKDSSKEQTKDSSKEQTNEVIGMLIAGAILSIPALLKYIISPILEKISRGKYAKQYGDVLKKIDSEYKSQGKKFYTSDVAAKVKHIGEEIHHAYVKPLKILLTPFIKDQKKRDLIAEAIYVVLVLFLTGYSAKSALSASDIATGASEAVIASIKGIDFTKGIGNVIDEIGNVINKLSKS